MLVVPNSVVLGSVVGCSRNSVVVVGMVVVMDVVVGVEVVVFAVAVDPFADMLRAYGDM